MTNPVDAGDPVVLDAVRFKKRLTSSHRRDWRAQKGSTAAALRTGLGLP